MLLSLLLLLVFSVVVIAIRSRSPQGVSDRLQLVQDVGRQLNGVRDGTGAKMNERSDVLYKL